MVKHIVFWNFNEAAHTKGTAEIAQELAARFASLQGEIDGLVRIEFGVSYKEGGHDAALCCEFTSRAAELSYQTHPLHVAIKEYVHTYFHERTFVDYEL